MFDPQSQPGATDCLFTTILGFVPSFHLAGIGGNADLSRTAVSEPIEAYNAVTKPELDLAGRLIGLSTSAMDNLWLSMRAYLARAQVPQYRGSIIARGRLAEQPRKMPEAMQTKREQRREQVATQRPMPRPAPVPVAPPPLAVPPRGTPPAQPQASAHPTLAHSRDSAFSVSVVESGFKFAFDTSAVHRNTHAMLAGSQASVQELEPEAPEASAARMGLNHRNHAGARTVI